MCVQCLEVFTNVCTGLGGAYKCVYRPQRGREMSFYRHKVKYLGVLERVMEHNDSWSSRVCTNVCTDLGGEVGSVFTGRSIDCRHWGVVRAH